MGKGGGGTQTTTQQNQLPQWVQQAGQQNLQAAYNVAQNMMGPYQGPQVADLTNGGNADIAAMQNNVGSTNPAYAVAQNTASGLTNYNPSQVNAGQLSNTNISAYMNPYTQNVVNSGLQALDVQRQQANNQIDDQAAKAGAFGGSRQGVAEGINNAAAAMNAGNLASSLMNQGYTNAVGQAQSDISNNLQAQLANQAAGLQGANLNLQSANSLGNLANTGQQSFLQGAASALAGQQTAQQNNQNDINAQMAAYTAAQQFPLQQLQIPLQALGATPYGSTSTSTTTGGSSNGLMTGLGAASSGIGILGGLKNLGLFAGF